MRGVSLEGYSASFGRLNGSPDKQTDPLIAVRSTGFYKLRIQGSDVNCSSFKTNYYVLNEIIRIYKLTNVHCIVEHFSVFTSFTK